MSTTTRAAVRAALALALALVSNVAHAVNDGAYDLVYPLSRNAHQSAYDPVRHRMIVVGGSHSGVRNDVWALATGGSPSWTQLAPAGTLPPRREYHSLIYDPVRDRLVMFGGVGDSTLSDVWALSLAGTPTWSQLLPTGTGPGPRWGHSAVYDPVRDRMLVFGGSGKTTDNNDVWAMSLGASPAWTPVTTSGFPPVVRHTQSVVYDSAHDQLVLYAGLRWIPPSSSQLLNDVWTLSLAGTPTWTLLSPSGTAPDARYEHTAVYDPLQQRMLVLGGQNAAVQTVLWSLTLSGSPAWTQPTPSGTIPPGRYQHTAVFDSDNDQMLVFAGLCVNTGNGFHSAETWALSLGGSLAWALVPAANSPPVPRNDAVATFDVASRRMVQFGGYTGLAYTNDLWQVSLPSGSPPIWSQLSPGGTPPSARTNAAAALDTLRQRLIVFGGNNGTTNYNDLYALTLAGGTSWTTLSPTGTPPSARWGHTAIYDAARDRCIVFGGYNGSTNLNDVIGLTMAGATGWGAISPAGTPPAARRDMGAIYDPVRDRMIVFGGFGTGGYKNDVWALTFSPVPTWSQLSPTGTPPGVRDMFALVYDSYRDRMLVVAGHDGVSFGILYDLWELPFSTLAWRKLNPTGTALNGENHVAIYDPVVDRLLISGLETQTVQFPTTYIVQVSVGAHGSASPSGTVGVVAGDNQTVNFTPAACYHIGQVMVDGAPIGTPASYTFTNVQAPHTLAVSFAVDVETISATTDGHGSITPAGPVPVDCGSSQGFTIAPSPSYNIGDVLVDGVSVGPVTTYTFGNVTGPHTIAVSFAAKPNAIEPFCATDGSVSAIDRSGNILYFGGSFTRVGPPTGGFAAVDTATGLVSAPYAGVNGSVLAVTSDGAGGWYIGGTFTKVRDASRTNLAHILASGAVSAWAPNPDNQVTAIAVSGDKVCVGGRFNAIAGESMHPSFAILDSQTGKILYPISANGGFPPVTAIATAGNKAFLTGQFTATGTTTGGWAKIDTSSGLAVAPFAAVAGAVTTVIPDGVGGWFIGGGFSTVQGLAHPDVAHILASGLVSSWNPSVAGGTVDALALSGNTLYIGGSFTAVGGATRNYGAAVDATTGALLSWNPSANNSIRSLAVSGSVVYASGDFTSIGGSARNHFAALGATIAAATAWNPNANSYANSMVLSGGLIYTGGGFTSIGGSTRMFVAALDSVTATAQFWNPTANGAVNALVLSGSTMYVCGAFTNIGGQTRNRVAAVNLTNGAALAWNPNADGTVNSLTVAPNAIYAGGSFTSIGGASRSYLAALDATTGAASPWNTSINAAVNVVASSGGSVFAGGGFTTLAVTNRHYAAGVNLNTGLVSAWNPNPNGWPSAIVITNGLAYVGGAFGTIGGGSHANLAAVDTSTGNATSWNPSVTLGTWGIRAMAIANNTVYIGGDITAVGGIPRSELAAVDATTGIATSWNPGASSTVYGLAVANGVVYAGGAFTTAGGKSRSRLASIDAASGVATSWNPDAGNTVWALALSQGRLGVGGDMTLVNSVPRANLAAMDVTTGLATAWNPGCGPVYALRAGPGKVYVGGSFSTVGGASRQNIAAIDSTTGLATSWNPTSGGTVYAIAVAGPVVYAGGQFGSIGGQSRIHLAALDAATGQAIFWNPDPNGNTVYALLPVPGGLYVGGDFTAISGTARSGAAYVDSASGAAGAWNPSVGTGGVEALAKIDNAIYLGGYFTTVGGQTRTSLAAVNATTGSLLSWNPAPNDYVYTLAAAGGVLYVGGQFTTIGGRTRNRLAAIDGVTGSVTGWHPDLDARVTALAISGHMISVGGIFTTAAGRLNRSVAAFADVATVDVPAGNSARVARLELRPAFPDPLRRRGTIPFTLPRDAVVTLRIYDVAGRCVRTLLDRAWLPAGRHDLTITSEGLENGLYFYRLEASGSSANGKLIVLRN